MAADRKGQCWAVVAASEQGKGVWVKQQLRRLRPPRLVVWDRVDEYGSFARKVENLVGFAQACKGERFAVRYVPRAHTQRQFQQEFDLWCRIAYHCVGAVVLVEELSDVTTPSYAPPAWRRLNSMGRHHQGLTIVGCSQTPATIDKTFLGNATLLHVGFLGQAAHRKAVAAELDIDPDRIRELRQFEYLELDRSSGNLRRGKVQIAPKARRLEGVAPPVGARAK